MNDSFSAYPPNESECEKSSNSYLMSVITVIVSFPFPLISLITTLIFYLDLIEKLYRENEKKLENLIINELTDENKEIKLPGLNAIIDSMPEELVWFSTHPDARERAALIRVKKKEMHTCTVPLIKTL